MGIWGNTADSGGLRGVFREVRLAIGDLVGGKLDPSHEILLQILFGLLGSLARADGLVSTEEADYTNSLMDELELGTRARQLASEAFQNGTRRQVDLERELQRFLIAFPHGSTEVDRLFDSLVRLAAADKRIRPSERAFLERITSGLGYLPEVLEQRLQNVMR